MSRVCRICGEEKPIEQFSWKHKAQGTRQTVCKKCAAEETKAWREKVGPEGVRATNQRYYASSREIVLQQKKDYYQRSKEDIKIARRRAYWRDPNKWREQARRYYWQNREDRLAKRRAYGRQIKLDALAAYGGSCVCCGETTEQFLTIDHIDGCTKEQRKREGLGTSFYLHLKKNGWPDGYQTLCFNCNMGRQINGGICPHQASPIDSRGA